MTRLTLNLLGPPEALLDGAAVSFDRQKALALLGYLAIEPAPHGREQLAGLLWPDLAPPRAQAALRQALWSITAGLGAGWLSSDRLRVQLRPDAEVDLDVRAFREAVAAARRGPPDLAALEAAAGRWRGELLAGLELRDAGPFDEWRFFAGEALRADLAWALDTIAAGRASEGAHGPALEAARRRLALDPLHEPAHRQLMRLYAAAGQLAAALRQYEECARILRQELDADPDEETAALHQELRAERGRGEPRGGGRPEAPRQPAPQTQRLPRPATPFIGREPELATIAGLLADPGCRLISLLGPGGIGKTRLAIEAAARAAPAFADGAAFVPLAAVADREGIPSALAAAMGLSSLRADSLTDQIQDYLRARELLLVVDNLEHLVDGAGLLGDLLEGAPDLRILATSRERLGLPGEWAIDIGGLPLPPAGAEPGDSGALALFAQAARRAGLTRELSAAELAAAAAICQLVGGAPLAIELAAAWLRLMPVAQVAEALRANLDFLEGGARGLPERHRGLRAVFEHSWRLLSPDERATFAALAIFRGGFTLEAAAAVCGRAAAPTILALVDKSLVRRTDERRYDLHELLRQYAAEHLGADAAAHERARLAHARHYTAMLKAAEPHLKGAGQRDTIEQLAGEINNLRAAWRSAVARVDTAALAAGTTSLYLLYETRSLFEEGEEMFGRAATALASSERPASPDESVLLGNLLARQGWFALRLYRFAAASALNRWALELLREHLDRPDALAGSLIANFQSLTGGEVHSPELLHEQLERLRAAGDQWDLARALYWRGLSSISAEEAVHYIGQSLEVSRAAGNLRQTAESLDALADQLQDACELAAARERYGEALAIYHAIGYRWAEAYALDKMGYVARLMGDYGQSAAEHQASLAVSRELGDRLGVAGSLDNLALLALDEGRLGEAEGLAREGLAIRRAVGHPGSTSISLETLALVLSARGEHRAALELLAECGELRRDSAGLWLMTRVLSYTGRVHLARGDLPSARLYLLRALAHAVTYRVKPEQPPALADIARLLAAEGRPAAAAELAAELEARFPAHAPVRRAAAAVLAQAGRPPAPPRPLAELIAGLLA